MSIRVTHTPKDAANILGVSVAWLYKAMGRGDIVTLKFGTRRLIHQDDLNAFIEANRRAKHVRLTRPVDEVNRQRLTKAA